MQKTSRVLLLAIAAVVRPELAAAQPDTEPGASPVIVRGSSSAQKALTTAESGGIVVLRGTPPPVPLPPPIYTCVAGYVPDPSLGCVVPGVVYGPNDLGYWPYPWFYDFSPNARPHRFRRGFLRFAHREFRRR